MNAALMEHVTAYSSLDNGGRQDVGLLRSERRLRWVGGAIGGVADGTAGVGFVEVGVGEGSGCEDGVWLWLGRGRRHDGVGKVWLRAAGLVRLLVGEG